MKRLIILSFAILFASICFAQEGKETSSEKSNAVVIGGIECAASVYDGFICDVSAFAGYRFTPAFELVAGAGYSKLKVWDPDNTTSISLFTRGSFFLLPTKFVSPYLSVRLGYNIPLTTIGYEGEQQALKGVAIEPNLGIAFWINKARLLLALKCSFDTNYVDEYIFFEPSFGLRLGLEF